MHAAGNEIVARAFRRGAREHGRFDFDEAHLVHHFADFENDAMAQREIAQLPRAPQVDVAIAQARFFGGVGFVFDRERRRLGGVQDVELGGNELDFAAG
jgi:hypothetical protein